MPSKSKRIGTGYEYEIRDLLRETTGDKSFERVPLSGSITGGTNFAKRETQSAETLEAYSGDISTPTGFRWIIECKNYEDFSINAMIFAERYELLEGFLSQVSFDAEKTKLEPLLFVKIRQKNDLPDKLKKFLKEQKIDRPKVNTRTIGSLVFEQENLGADLRAPSSLTYTDKENIRWIARPLDVWMESLPSRRYLNR